MICKCSLVLEFLILGERLLSVSLGKRKLFRIVQNISNLCFLIIDFAFKSNVSTIIYIYITLICFLIFHRIIRCLFETSLSIFEIFTLRIQ